MIKLIVSDMDGTLLNEKGQIPERFWDLEERLQEEGIHFCPASGRQYFNLEKLFSKIQDHSIFIAENGAIVVYQGEVLAKTTMDRSLLKEWREKTKNSPSAQMVFCGEKSAYIEEPKMPELLEEMQKYYLKLQIVDNIEEVEDSLLKVAVCDLNGANERMYPHFKEYEKDFQVVLSGGHWLDLMDKAANKGHALEQIKERLKIQDDELMIFGDYLNDYEMMSCGEHSFAMENAHPLLKEKAKHLAKSNKEEGVLESIQDFLELS